jgi:hypothetical protein
MDGSFSPIWESGFDDWSLGVLDNPSFSGLDGFYLHNLDDSLPKLLITEGGLWGFNTINPQVPYHFKLGSGIVFPTFSSSTVALFDNGANSGDTANITIMGGTAGYSTISFGDRVTENLGVFRFNHSTETFEWLTTSTTHLTMTNAGVMALTGSFTVDTITLDASSIVGVGNGVVPSITFTGYGNAPPSFIGRRASGTLASPTASTSSMALSQIIGIGYDTTNGFVEAASIKLQANQAWTNTAHGTRIEFLTVRDGTTTYDTKMALNDRGDLILTGGIVPLQSISSSRKYLTMQGSADYSIVELGSGAADSNLAVVGSLQGIDVHSSGENRIAAISFTQSGATAGNRGGRISIATKANNGALTTRLNISDAGVFDLSGILNIVGDVDIVGNISTNGFLYTGTQLNNIAAGASLTIFTPANDTVWTVITYSNGAVSERAEARIFVSNTGIVVAQGVYASTHSIGISGSNVQVTNGAASARNIRTTWLRLR